MVGFLNHLKPLPFMLFCRLTFLNDDPFILYNEFLSLYGSGLRQERIFAQLADELFVQPFNDDLRIFRQFHRNTFWDF